MKYLQKIVEYGLYLLIFLLPVQARWIIKAGANEYGTISLYGTDIVLILLLILFIIYKFLISNSQFPINVKCQMSNVKCREHWWFIAVLELAALVSIFFAPDKLLAVYAYARLLLGIGLFWLVTSAVYDKIKLIHSFLAGAILQAGLGIWQFLSQSSFASKWLGIAAHNAGDLGTSVVETLNGERWLRAYGGLDHPNVLGGVMAASILILVFHGIYSGQFLIFNFKFLNNFLVSKFLNIFTFYFLLFTFITSLFFTFSRGAWAGVIVGVLAMLIMAVWQRDVSVQKKILGAILAGAVLVAILFSQYNDLVLTRLSRDTRLEIKSNTERINSYKDGWRVIKENWLFGAGIGNYTKYNANKFPQPSHNVFLLIWAETGALGIIGFVGLFIYLIIKNCLKIKNLKFKINNNNNSNNSIFYKTSLFSALLVVLFIDHWLWSLHFGILFFWFVLGLIAVDFKEKRHYN
ncbi:O-antigen ligase family protein [Candidatus Falkowbacteria bacterium]|nr:O-antigen ligase family protein [Candidatus Falkowbacteria bacterium]